MAIPTRVNNTFTNNSFPNGAKARPRCVGEVRLGLFGLGGNTCTVRNDRPDFLMVSIMVCKRCIVLQWRIAARYIVAV